MLINPSDHAGARARIFRAIQADNFTMIADALALCIAKSSATTWYLLKKIKCIKIWLYTNYFDDLVQDSGNSIADAMELPQSSTKPSMPLQWPAWEGLNMCLAWSISCVMQYQGLSTPYHM